MTIDRMSLLDLIHKSGVKGDVDFLREGLKVLAQAVMELEVSQKTGAERHDSQLRRYAGSTSVNLLDWNERFGEGSQSNHWSTDVFLKWSSIECVTRSLARLVS